MITVEVLKKLTFGEDVIRYQTIKVRGGIRRHVHEYPHTPGGAPEKLGRKLYQISLGGVVLADTGDTTTDWGASAWPDKLNRLMLRFEQQITDDLHLPHIGTLKAYAVDWERDLNVLKIRNGETIDISFEEDQSEQFLVSEIVQTAQTGIDAKMSDFQLKSAMISPQPSIFDTIQKAFNEGRALFDQADVWQSLLASKLEQLAQMFRLADQTLDELNKPANYELLAALHELWAATIDLAKDVTMARGGVWKNWTVPRDMAVSEASIGIYGDTEHAMDLMQFNLLEDPYNVRAGTSLRYLEAA